MTDQAKIEQTIQTYIETMHESSAEKVAIAFHPGAKITGYLDDGLHEMSRNDFAEFVASQQPSPREQGLPAPLEIVSLDIAGETAVARVRCQYLGLAFLDTLSLLKVDGNWQIYNKLFHVEGQVAS
jgi:hypothetical protein